MVPADLAHWRDSSTAALLATGLFCTLIFMIYRWDATKTGGFLRSDRWTALGTNLALGNVSFVFLALTVLTGSRHDYILHKVIWHEVNQGHDPWFTVIGIYGTYPLNAYGPLFNALAPLARLDPLAPKLLCAYAYLLIAVGLTKHFQARQPSNRLSLLLLFVWFWNPFPWLEIAVRGHFDILAGLAAVAALHARLHERDIRSGLYLSIGVLLKYIPLVLLPFLALDRGRFRFRLFLTGILVIVLGMALSYKIWGDSLFRPLTLAGTRFSTYLSIFRFLRGRYSPLHWVTVAPNYDWLSPVILFVALLRAWTWARLNKVDAGCAATLAILTTLLLYQNGFPQYQMVSFVVVSYWVVRDWDRLPRRYALAASLVFYFGWISLFNAFFCAEDEADPAPLFDWRRVEDAVGLPTFLLGCALIVCVVRSARFDEVDDATHANADRT
jgi:hypothetical protein